MREIEKRMLQAVANGENWSQGNTSTRANSGMVDIFLHGNRIATYNQSTRQVIANDLMFYKWPTSTTKSRLNALGCHAVTRGGIHQLTPVAQW